MPKVKKPKTKITPQTAWIKTRMAELGETAETASRALDTYPNMIWRMLSGARPARPEELATWCRLLRLSYAATARRFGVDVPDLTVPIIGIVRDDGRVTVLPPNLQSRIESPESSGCDLVALRVDAPQSALAIFDGAHLYYQPSNVVRVDAFGRLSVVELGDHPSPLLGIIDRASVGKGRVRLFGGIDTIESDQMISASPIRWQKA